MLKLHAPCECRVSFSPCNAVSFCSAMPCRSFQFIPHGYIPSNTQVHAPYTSFALCRPQSGPEYHHPISPSILQPRIPSPNTKSKHQSPNRGFPSVMQCNSHSSIPNLAPISYPTSFIANVLSSLVSSPVQVVNDVPMWTTTVYRRLPLVARSRRLLAVPVQNPVHR